MSSTDIIEIPFTTQARPRGRSNSVLVAEDDPVSRRILEVRLKNWGYDITIAVNGLQALDTMRGPLSPELLLLDWMMPGIDGVELCRRIRELHKPVYPYILLLTARDAKQDLVTGLEAGADVYLTKPFHAEELQARLKAGTRILTLQKELIDAREQLRFQATHDPLTGIWSRGAIIDFLSQELERARRSGQPLGAMLLDIDHFKAVNDTFGHPVGDVVLREVANRFVHSVRSYDWVGRYGGEEFLIVLSNASLEDVRRRAELIRTIVSDTPVRGQSGFSVPITVSIGAAGLWATRDMTPEQILQRADVALYRAKELGRNRVETTPNE